MLPSMGGVRAEIVLLTTNEKLEGEIVVTYDRGILFREKQGSPGRYYPYEEVSRVYTKDGLLYYLMPRGATRPKTRRLDFFPLAKILLPRDTMKAPHPHVRLPRGEAVEATCAGAADAVTIILGGGARVHLLGLAPPPKSAGTRAARKAMKFTESKVKGKTVLLYPGPQSGENAMRTDAYVVVDNRLLNAELLQNGWARVESRGTRHPYQEAFRSLQRFAQNLKLGMWASSAPED